MMPDVMLDLETAGTRPDAPIIAIGAVTFDMKNGVLGERFYITVDLASCVQQGARIDPSTFMWWLQQSDKARQGVVGGMQMHISEACVAFKDWLYEHSAPQNAVKPWGNSSSFDCTILKEHYFRAGLEAPWAFWNERCFRTLAAMYPNIERKHTGTVHNALDDAISQAEHLILIRKTLQGKTNA